MRCKMQSIHHVSLQCIQPTTVLLDHQVPDQQAGLCFLHRRSLEIVFRQPLAPRMLASSEAYASVGSYVTRPCLPGLCLHNWPVMNNSCSYLHMTAKSTATHSKLPHWVNIWLGNCMRIHCVSTTSYTMPRHTAQCTAKIGVHSICSIDLVP